MKRAIFILLAFFTFHTVSAQIGGSDEVYLNGDKIDAKFQGGDLNKFHDFVISNLDKSKIVKEGQLVCGFTVNEEGQLKNIRIIKDLGGESAFEMIRVLRLSPKWQPAMRNGKPIAIDIKLPFTFVKEKNNQSREETLEIDVVDNQGKNENDKVYVAVEKPAEFPGGNAAFMDYFIKNFKSSVQLKEQIKVMATFIVNMDGSLSEVKILRISNSNVDVKNEIVRVISNSPKWIPAQQNGKKIRMQYTLPIRLTIK